MLDGNAHIAKDAVARILENSDLPSDGMLIVHSAFANFSRQGIRAEAFIESLIDAFPDGTLLMPVMTWRTVTITHPYFDEIETKSETGILSEIFRKKYATARSIHPTHSAAACGKLAKFMTSGHQNGVTPCPPNSPFGRLSEMDAHILMLGVGLETCTAIHCWEEKISPEYYMRPLDEAVIYDCRDRHGHIHKVRARRHQRLNRDFPKFAVDLRALGQFQEGSIEGAKWQYCECRNLQAIILDALNKDPQATVTN